MTRSPSRSFAPGCAASDRHVDQAGHFSRVRYTNCRPISYAELCAIFGDDPIDAWAAERIQMEEVRRLNWPKIVRAFCLAVATFCVVYFGMRLLVAWVVSL